MAGFNIEDHEWYDSDINCVQLFNAHKDRVLLHLIEDSIVDMFHISEKDSIALAKHFGHYKKPTK